MNLSIESASAIIFDLEGVLIDTEPIWDEAQRLLLARRGHEYNRRELKHRLTGLPGNRAVAVLIDHYRLSDGIPSLLAERKEIMCELLSQGIDPMPGARAFVEAAEQRVATCVATSMDADLLEVASGSVALRPVLTGRIFTNEHVSGRGKPAPDIFLLAASELGYQPSECVVIEDSPSGIAAARAAGISSIALCTTHDAEHLGEADLVVPGWSSVPLPAPGLQR